MAFQDRGSPKAESPFLGNLKRTHNLYYNMNIIQLLLTGGSIQPITPQKQHQFPGAGSEALEEDGVTPQAQALHPPLLRRAVLWRSARIGIYASLHIPLCACTYIHIYVYMYLQYTCVFIYMYLYACVAIHITYTCADVSTDAYTYIYICTHIYMYVYTCMHIYTYTYTYMYMYVCTYCKSRYLHAYLVFRV